MSTKRMKRLGKNVFLLTLLAGGFSLPAVQAGAGGGPSPRAHDMRLVGSDDLQARSAYQPVVHEHPDGRWILYQGHHNGQAPNPLNGGAVETNGVSIVDVTDPANPVYLHHLPGVAGAQMVRTCNGTELPQGINGRVYLLRSNGNLEHQVYDVTDPTAPVLVSTPVTGLGGTHKNYWECSTGIAYLVSGVPGWRTNRMTQIFDLSNPANPVFIRNFGLDGQQPGSVGEVPTSLHGCLPVIDRNRVYCGHGTRAEGHLVILDRNKLLTDPLLDPANPTPAELASPLVVDFRIPDHMGAHSTIPLLGYHLEEFANDDGGAYADRDFVAIVNEAIANECGDDFRQFVYLADITDEVHPMPVSNFDVSEAEGDYCSVGGRFGAHAGHENPTGVYHRKLLFVSWFNAGVRAIDVRDPFNPRQAAFYVPKITANTDDRGGKFAIQTNNVEVDDRGFIYISDRANTGLHILELTGNAKQIADLP